MSNLKVRTGDLRLIRNINNRLVMNIIRERGLISGSELSHITGMQPSTISKILKDLQAKNLILNVGKGESTFKGGKKPFLWKINDKAAFAVGVDVEIGEIAIIILDLLGNPLKKRVYKTDDVFQPEKLEKTLISCIRKFFKDPEIDMEKILGMCIAFAGVVNRQTGTVVITDVVNKTNFVLTKNLKEEFGFPIVAENNANAAALGSKWVGSGKGLQHFITILLEINEDVSGMGAGLILNGELYHGSSFCSGEMNVNIPPMKNILSRAREVVDDNTVLENRIFKEENVDIFTVIDAAKNGDAVAVEFFTILGQIIGKTIVLPVALINPERVIIAGEVAEVGDLIVDPIRNEFRKEMLKASLIGMEVAASREGRYAVASGAAAVILEDWFKMPQISMIS